MNSIRFVATAALLAAGSTTCLFAQNTRATVTGKIVDNTKEPVIGALVTVKNESTGLPFPLPLMPTETIPSEKFHSVRLTPSPPNTLVMVTRSAQAIRSTRAICCVLTSP